MQRYNFHLEDSDLAGLKSLTDLKVAEHIRLAIKQYLRKNLKETTSISSSPKGTVNEEHRHLLNK